MSKYNLWLAVVFAYYIFSSLIYAVFSIAKYNRYSLTPGDLCIFNQGIWQYSQFRWPIITFHLDKPFLADHFHPILISLAPFYWIYPNERTLLFLQPFILLSAMIPIFLLTRHLTKSIFLGFALIFSYSLYLPIQYTLFFDFHEIAFFPPLFAWVYYFFIKEKKIFVGIFLTLILLVKEELGFLVAAFGLYLLIFAKNWRIFGLIWVILGSLYSLLIIHIVIPFLGGNYRYLDYGAAGNSPLGVLINIFKDPLKYFQLLFDSPVKQETLYRTFWPFSFLPLLSPVGILLSLEQFVTRFFDLKTTNRWTLHYHYSAPMAAIAAIGTINALYNIGSRIKKYRRWLFFSAALLLIILTRLEQINASVVLLGKRPEFWQKSPWMQDLDEAITKVDKTASLSAPKDIICHLSTRKKAYFFEDRQDMDYILIRLNPDQFNDFISRKRPYQIVFQKGEVYIFKRMPDLL